MLIVFRLIDVRSTDDQRSHRPKDFSEIRSGLRRPSQVSKISVVICAIMENPEAPFIYLASRTLYRRRLAVWGTDRPRSHSTAWLVCFDIVTLIAETLWSP